MLEWFGEGSTVGVTVMDGELLGVICSVLVVVSSSSSESESESDESESYVRLGRSSSVSDSQSVT